MMYIIKQYDDGSDKVEQMFLFSTREKAITELRHLRDRAKKLGRLEDENLNFAAPYVTVIAEDGIDTYTFTLDPVSYPVDIKF